MQSGSHNGNSGDTRLAELARRQHGVVSTAQLRRLGYSKHTIHDRAAAGRLHRIHRGVYAVGHTNLAIRGRWMAAVLACGPGALLSHRDAAALQDLRTIASGLIHVAAPSRHTIPGIRCHYVRRQHPEDGVLVDGIPVTSVSRTLLDLAEIELPRKLRTALEQAQRLRTLDIRALDTVIARHPGRRGVKPLREAIAALSDEPLWRQSELEEDFLELVLRAGFPLPRTNVYVEGELVDAVWPERNLVVELDGWNFHRTKGSFEEDRRRDSKLAVRHWRVVRFTYNRLRYEPAGVVVELSELLRDGPGRRRARSGQ